MPNKVIKSQEFATRLRMARLRAGLNQSQLSLRAGISRGTVFDIENGRRIGNVGIATAEQLAGALSVAPAWLAFGVGTPEGFEALDEGRDLEVKLRSRMESLFIVLQARQINITEEIRDRVTGADLESLNEMLIRAATALSAKDVLGTRPPVK